MDEAMALDAVRGICLQNKTLGLVTNMHFFTIPEPEPLDPDSIQTVPRVRVDFERGLERWFVVYKHHLADVWRPAKVVAVTEHASVYDTVRRSET